MNADPSANARLDAAASLAHAMKDDAPAPLGKATARTTEVAQPADLDAGPVLVIDIGGTNVKFGYTIGGRVSTYRKLVSSHALKTGDAVAALAAMIDSAIREQGSRPHAIVAAIPGYIDTDLDHVLTAPNVAGLEGRRLATDLAKLVGCPVYLERDSVLALMGEVHSGAAQGCDSVMGLYFGTGVGGAYLHDSQPFRGSGWALEIGRMPFMSEGRCLPGLREDCLEAYASGRALQVIADKYGMPIGEAFRIGPSDPLIQADLDQFVLYQALAVGVGIAMMSPSTIVLGGGVLEMADYPRERLRALVERHSPIAETRRALDLRWCHHGWAAVLHGAHAIVAKRR
ncbi:MAG TPA: ROK family protein [Pararobbsia sp.]|nr:ROK family protein [Pararobbsia sp.]